MSNGALCMTSLRSVASAWVTAAEVWELTTTTQAVEVVPNWTVRTEKPGA